MWTSCLDDLVEALATGEEPPAWLLDTITMFIPEGEASTTTDFLTMMAAELRPIALMQTIAKVIVYQANQALAALGICCVSAARVCEEQEQNG